MQMELAEIFGKIFLLVAEPNRHYHVGRGVGEEKHKGPRRCLRMRRGFCAGPLRLRVIGNATASGRTAFPDPAGGLAMPPWLEILLDVAGFAGFIAIATWRRSPRKNGKPTPH
jgi:hypothetical protein